MPKEKKEARPISKRNFISLETKIKILDQLKNNERIADISRHLNLNESSIRTIRQAEDKIRDSVVSGSSVLAKVTARPRATIMEKMEQALTVWVEDITTKRLPIDKNIIKQSALKIFDCLKENSELSADDTSHKFVASNGWFEKF
ncbi:HTH CENPB-type domain-containing protein [Trichonephila clavata]|uniref:HTH CENPB-type domain-containing protein n=1 Tax=Trichonephila clavata TaxID=2740835 RepID=A0A8X6LMM0_TRICU|nr:HTH CENPB-type domain-containing protein [Trichonephila clavata]